MFSLTLHYFLQHYIGDLNQCDKPRPPPNEIKLLNITNEEVKLSLYLNYIIAYIETPKESMDHN